MKKSLYLVILLLLQAFYSQAQQDPQFSQYMFNKMYLNPAVAGIDPEYGEFTLIHRSQWLGYTSTFDDGDAPTTQSLSFSMPMPRKESHEGNIWGLGANFINDKLGAFGSQEAHLSIAHHIRLKTGQISIGIRGGFYRQVIDFDIFRPVDTDDPLIPSLGQRSEMKGDLSAGLYYNTTKYFIGLGVGRLLGSEFNFGETSNPLQSEGFTKLVTHANILLGYNWDVSPSLTISPTAIIKYAAVNNISVEFTTIGTIDEKYYFGLAYRQGDAATALLGINLMPQKQLRIGYAFDLVVRGENAKSATSQELRLTYRIPPIIKRMPSIIRTPRFKHF